MFVPEQRSSFSAAQRTQDASLVGGVALWETEQRLWPSKHRSEMNKYEVEGEEGRERFCLEDAAKIFFCQVYVENETSTLTHG